MAKTVDGYVIVELAYLLVHDVVRGRVYCPYCLRVMSVEFWQGKIYRCPACRVYWIRWLKSLFGAVWIEDEWPISIGLQGIEEVYAWRASELGRAA